MKKILIFALFISICVFTLAACGDSTTDEGDTAKENVTQEGDTQIDNAKELTAEGLLQAFKDGGMSIIDEIVYTSSTDPNEKLGRPGEYIAKINFNDGDFFEEGSEPELTIEVFSKKDDMVTRRDYIQSIVDSSAMNAFKYYIYDKDLFLFRIPYSVTPEKAAEYEKIFNEYTE